MSAIIYEGGKPRIMPETDTIYTDTVDGGICEWKPASSMEIGPAKITENGEFTADDFNYYGLSEVEIDVQEEVGDYIVSVDEDGKPHIETDDWDLTIDDYGFPDFGDLDIGEALENLEFDTDIDISFDDLNLNVDTLDTDFELNLDTLELTETELPDEIRIMHVPNKTSYKDGEEIDLDGLVVQAYRGGEVWNDESGRYIDGYVPVHELMASKVNTEFQMASNGEYSFAVVELNILQHHHFNGWNSENLHGIYFDGDLEFIDGGADCPLEKMVLFSSETCAYSLSENATSQYSSVLRGKYRGAAKRPIVQFTLQFPEDRYLRGIVVLWKGAYKERQYIDDSSRPVSDTSRLAEITNISVRSTSLHITYNYYVRAWSGEDFNIVYGSTRFRFVATREMDYDISNIQAEFRTLESTEVGPIRFELVDEYICLSSVIETDVITLTDLVFHLRLEGLMVHNAHARTFDSSLPLENGIFWIFCNYAYPKNVPQGHDNSMLDAWYAVYSDLSGKKGNALVSWPRFKDHKLLTDTFMISIEESEGGE